MNRFTTAQLVDIAERLRAIVGIAKILGITDPAARGLALKDLNSDENRAAVATYILQLDLSPKPALEMSSGVGIVGDFLRECTKECPGCKIGARELYASFKKWFGRRYVSAMVPSKKHFGTALRAAGVRAVKTSGRMFYFDIKMRIGAL